MSIPDHNSTVQTILSRLSGVCKSGGGWSARCPAHEDRHASLSVGVGEDGRVLLKCHANCSTEAIVRALGLEMSGLFPGTNGKPSAKKTSSKNTAVYETANAAVAALERCHGQRFGFWTYHNAQGNPVGLVVRWNRADGGKEFRPVSLYANGWRIEGMPKPRPLYHLPELLRTTGRVIVVEGEKAADAGQAIGLLTTTSPHGAQAAASADWTPLAGRDVLILPDNDKPGEKYGADVALILHGLTPRPNIKIVRLPNLPEGGDLVEYITAQQAAGLDAAAIRTAIDELALK